MEWDPVSKNKGEKKRWPSAALLNLVAAHTCQFYLHVLGHVGSLLLFFCWGLCFCLGKLLYVVNTDRSVGTKWHLAWQEMLPFLSQPKWRAMQRRVPYPTPSFLQPVENFLFFLQSQWDKVCVCWGWGEERKGGHSVTLSALCPQGLGKGNTGFKDWHGTGKQRLVWEV